MEHRLVLPLAEKPELSRLRAGDTVLISGTLFTARDQAHKRIAAAMGNGGSPPFPLEANFIYYCGPTPPRADGLFGSAGPTTSARMDPFTPALYAAGLCGTIGKGNRSAEVLDACRAFNAVYLVAFGGAGAYLAKTIERQETAAYPELGPEAVYRLTVRDFPAIVAFDASGRSLFG